MIRFITTHCGGWLTPVLLLSLINTSPLCAAPREAFEDEVRTCQFLSHVSGNSGYGERAGWTIIAKHAALRHAESIGASDVVWDRFAPVGIFNGIAEGRAYACKNQHLTAN